MPTIFTKNGTALTIPFPGDSAYWAVKFKSGKWVCERDIVSPFMAPARSLDWTLDIQSTGDWRAISELWLFCPQSKESPFGATAHLPISEPGTAFQLKVATMDSNFAESQRSLQAHIIGRVNNFETGACDCWIYDYVLGALLVFPQTHERDGRIIPDDQEYGPFKSSVYNFGSWRKPVSGKIGIPPLGPLNLQVLGIRQPIA